MRVLKGYLFKYVQNMTIKHSISAQIKSV